MEAKKLVINVIIGAATWLVLVSAMGDEPLLKRTPLSNSDIQPAKLVNNVAVVRLDFAPGQPTGRHMHPVPVIGYVLEGEFAVKIEGHPERKFTAGQSIYEPANTVIERYDNVSKTKRAVLIATYLAGSGEREVIKFLPGK